MGPKEELEDITPKEWSNRLYEDEQAYLQCSQNIAEQTASLTRHQTNIENIPILLTKLKNYDKELKGLCCKD